MIETVAPPRPQTVPTQGSVFTPAYFSYKTNQSSITGVVHLPWCCFPDYRPDGKPSTITVKAPQHPIAKGLPAKFQVGQTEMYNEPFHVPEPDELIFEETWELGEQRPLVRARFSGIHGETICKCHLASDLKTDRVPTMLEKHHFNESSADEWNAEWQNRIADWVTEQMQSADSGHGIDHVQRVVENAKKIGRAELANANIYLPAAWLHDCVTVPKNSPQRHAASSLAAQSAEGFLAKIAYPAAWIGPISHCILAHSFSAKVPCQSVEAKVVQDSDRLEAVGAIGLARCLMTGGAMGQRLYHPSEPFPFKRLPADAEQSIDHFFVKLLGLQKTMQTEAGRDEARRRSEFLVAFLRQLANEIGVPSSTLDIALQRVV